MRLNLRIVLLLVATFILTANQAFSQPLMDDKFDDNDPLVNASGVGGGVNPTLGGTGVEASGIYHLSLTNSASQSGVLSQQEFSGNSATPLVATYTYDEMIRPLNVDGQSVATGTSRWYAGFFDNQGDDGDDNYQVFGNIPASNGNPDGGLWVAFKEREDQVAFGPLNGDEGSLYYCIDGQTSYLLSRWTWDRSVFSYDEQAIANGLRSDEISQDLLVPSLSSLATTPRATA